MNKAANEAKENMEGAASKGTAKGPPKSGAKDEEKIDGPAPPDSIFDKISKEMGFADFFDKHESGGFEVTDDKKGMSLQEARKILQFDASNPNIKKEEITKNFREISRQNHPDLGGSAFMAAKVNEARETLLKHNKKTQRRR